MHVGLPDYRARMPRSGQAARPQRRVRVADGEARAAILAATERLLAKRPLHELSVPEIVEEAGTSRASLYFYFAGKSAILAALADTTCHELINILQPWLDGDGGIEESDLRHCFEGSVQLWSQHRSILTATVESWRLDPEVGMLWGNVIGTLVERTSARIQRGRDAGHVIGHGDATALAETLIWSTERMHYVGLAGIAPALADPRCLTNSLVELWTGVLAPAPER